MHSLWETKFWSFENGLTHKTDFLLTPETASQILGHFLWSLNDFFLLLVFAFGYLFLFLALCNFLFFFFCFSFWWIELGRAADTNEGASSLFFVVRPRCCFVFFLAVLCACRPAVLTQSMQLQLTAIHSLSLPPFYLALWQQIEWLNLLVSYGV